MTYLNRFLTFTLIGWVALQVAAKATTLETHDHRAVVACTASPAACGMIIGQTEIAPGVIQTEYLQNSSDIVTVIENKN
jgi:hypothetical protein